MSITSNYRMIDGFTQIQAVVRENTFLRFMTDKIATNTSVQTFSLHNSLQLMENSMNI
jgi:hypothetical protein